MRFIKFITEFILITTLFIVVGCNCGNSCSIKTTDTIHQIDSIVVTADSSKLIEHCDSVNQPDK